MAIASGNSADEGQVDVDLMVDSSVVHEPVPQSWEGIFPNFRPSKKSPKKKADFSNALLLYGTNCVVSDSSKYKFGKVGHLYQVFAKECNGKGGRIRTVANGATHWSCNRCFSIYKSKSGAGKISQTIRARVVNIVRAITATKRKELTNTDYKDMKNLDHGNDKLWSESGLDLLQQVKTMVDYYDSVSILAESIATRQVLNANEGLVPSKDKFLSSFMSFYKAEKLKTPDKQNLIYALLATFLAKERGINNPVYGERLRNFYMVAYSMSPKTANFISNNLNGISKRQVSRIRASRRGSPVINRTDEEIVDVTVRFIKDLRIRSGDNSKRVAFSAGVDASVVVKGYQ